MRSVARLSQILPFLNPVMKTLATGSMLPVVHAVVHSSQDIKTA